MLSKPMPIFFASCLNESCVASLPTTMTLPPVYATIESAVAVLPEPMI